MHNLLYYTNAEVAQDLERHFGPRLEALSQGQRIALLHYLAVQLNLGAPSLNPDEWPTLHVCIEQLEGTPYPDLLKMVEAIASFESDRQAQVEEGAIAS